jgi:hypothetical protein
MLITAQNTIKPKTQISHMADVIFNQAHALKRSESYGLIICEHAAYQRIYAALVAKSTVADCLPLVRLAFVRRNGTYQCSSLYDGELDITDVTPGFFDQLTEIEKKTLLKKDFSIKAYYQERANKFFNSVINSPRIRMAKRADAKFAEILKLHRATLERSAMCGPHGHIPLSFPKGRRQYNMSGLATALKETYEETGIKQSDLITWHKKRCTVNYVDYGTRYKFIFYPAVCKVNIELKLNRDLINMYDEVTGLFYASREELITYGLDSITLKIYYENYNKFANCIIEQIKQMVDFDTQSTDDTDDESKFLPKDLLVEEELCDLTSLKFDFI